MPVRSERTHKSVCAKVYPVAERHWFVWLWIGDAEKADVAPIPDFWPCSCPDWISDGGYYPMKCDYRLLIDKLMDLTHETYAHQGSIGQLEILDVPIDTHIDGDSVTVMR